MHKLAILIDAPADWTAFEDGWPDFLHQAERMPGLRREATSRVESILYGQSAVTMVHELYFDSPEDARQALASSPGREAGKILQRITDGRMVLFFADHKEDELENIRRGQPD
jgi:uncharacterized protein (TIGR02118 family)